MSFGLPYRYVNDKEILSHIGKPAELLVVDVRDSDFIGGHIKGCQNVPSNSFLDSVHELVKQNESVPRVVFHCALSQSRGPKAARIYAESRQDLLPNAKEQDVMVLRAKYGTDKDLVENYRKELWDC
ncbi:hypothetical protein E3P92_02450 [Wallemia ichthyophaga]|uniref:Rhodanese domain-containing protein n=1 Tax=Wallemia ichthyophaga TaxID=245174 RepID=A0A4T0H837_WALIC|nr:hypothetical protein E3P91_02462 [Wallemia ichthyophaga]TIA81148.1 hypothetical protein E3P98_02267 [Wallemia ichthyophaga]TIA90648.1 hypothetical protein E3P97_02463 [Wallemia ichthyophaga]TIA99410.1 hypothetical protein E3P95_02105 [Wallemia ichthyophaga]TIB00373.1 hypothetical protein E3P94_02229 [Wallemia ichthyophaga]